MTRWIFLFVIQLNRNDVGSSHTDPRRPYYTAKVDNAGLNNAFAYLAAACVGQLAPPTKVSISQMTLDVKWIFKFFCHLN